MSDRAKYENGERIAEVLSTTDYLASRPPPSGSRSLEGASALNACLFRGDSASSWPPPTQGTNILYVTLLNRKFAVDELGKAWVSNIYGAAQAYIRSGQGWLYLATAIDLADR